jgi:microcystin-dependent protein
MEAFVGEIRVFAGDFVPYGWALCDGRQLSVLSERDLFLVIGNIYGGDGTTTFKLPNLIGRAPMHHGTGSGLTHHELGDATGTAAVALTEAQLPQHTHMLKGSSATSGGQADPTNAVWGSKPPFSQKVYGTGSPVAMNPHALSVVGGSEPHNNRQPYLGVNFIICLDGVMPPHL